MKVFSVYVFISLAALFPKCYGKEERLEKVFAVMWTGRWSHLLVSHVRSTRLKRALIGRLSEAASRPHCEISEQVGVCDSEQGSGQLEIPACPLAPRLLEWFCFNRYSCPHTNTLPTTRRA